jgi:hypothetical protein
MHTTTFESGGQTVDLPDSTADLRCGVSGGALADWVATYDVTWACAAIWASGISDGSTGAVFFPNGGIVSYRQ